MVLEYAHLHKEIILSYFRGQCRQIFQHHGSSGYVKNEKLQQFVDNRIAEIN